MSTLRPSEKSKLEQLLDMQGGYVLKFSDQTFGTFFAEIADVDIHADKYCKYGGSKAKKLRAFWDIESDELVSLVLAELISLWEAGTDADQTKEKLCEDCKEIVRRLRTGTDGLGRLEAEAKIRDAQHLRRLIRRLEDSVIKDHDLAIGSAKELIETVCKSILEERGKPVSGTPDIPTLTKTTLKELQLVPDGVEESVRGADTIKRVLRSLGSIANDLNELRNLYGTGHGKSMKSVGLTERHARLAVGAAVAYTTFLWDRHQETK